MPSLRKNNEPAEMGSSPLISQAGKSQDVANADNSTIHPDRFDMSRFSERQDEEESSLRIIVYVVVVIVIGVGLALLVRNLISTESNANPPQENEDQNNEQPIDQSALTISTTVAPDPSDAPTNEDLTDSLTLSVGNSNATTEGIGVNEFRYKRFTSFARVNLNFDGVTSEADLPRIVLNYDNTRNSLEVIFPTNIEIDEDLKDSIQVNDIVSNVVYNETSNSFVINMSESFKYRVVPTIGGLTIDIKTVAQIERGEDTEEEPEDEVIVEEPDTNTPTQPTQPTNPSAVKLDNEFSQSKQMVSGGISGNTINLTETYFEDTSSFFEIAWGEPNKVGTEFTPYASAEMTMEGSVPYIVLTIENLQDIQFEETGLAQNNIPINLAGANFVRADLESFSNGKAVIKIQLKNQANFRLVSIETISGQTQVLALQIND